MTSSQIFKLSKEDLEDLKKRKISEETFRIQLEQFQKGFPPLRLLKPCTGGDGIRQFSNQEIDRLAALFDREAPSKKILKFVPASGAASRMFQFLFEFQAQLKDPSRKDPETRKKAQEFFDSLEKFAFYEDLKQALAKSGQNLESLRQQKDYAGILEAFLSKKGLDYGETPKGLIPFHSYPNFTRKAFEEHLAEALLYAVGKDRTARIHFTVPDSKEKEFEKGIQEFTSRNETGGVQIESGLSFQSGSYDTVAVDENNLPLRDEAGRMIFRPGGHGALIYNLDALKADLIFIKNIDNVVPDRLKAETVRYKKALGGLLLDLQAKIFYFLKVLSEKTPNVSLVQEAAFFCRISLDIDLPPELEALPANDQASLLRAKLHRPLRVCGMVRNEGEPGGGPFWVLGKDGRRTLQIVESSQIDKSQPAQNKIWASATHFNPVDIACSTRGFDGRFFSLPDYVDKEAGFISSKSKGGKMVRALELPGLWNGAMSDWITIFVEVPLATFNPVKTVLDLIKPSHR